MTRKYLCANYILIGLDLVYVRKHLMEIPNLQQAIHRAQNYALSIQHPEGYWNGEVDSNATMEAEMLMLNYFLGIEDAVQQNKLTARILQLQHEDGAWGKYYGAPGELSTTIECYFALKLIGAEYTPKMKLACDFIIANGGIENARVFTKIWLALFGQWPWSKLPLLIPEIIFLPTWLPFNIYEFAVWARGVIVPLSIVLVKKPIIKINLSQSIAELFKFDREDNSDKDNAIVKKSAKKNKELSFHRLCKKFFSWRTLFNFIDALLKLYEKLPVKPGRKKAIDTAISWILERQEADGTWAGLQPAWAYSLLALTISGYDLQNPIIQKTLRGIAKNYTVITPETIHIQVTNSPVWDTCLMLTGFMYNTLNEQIKHSAQAAAKWLMQNQILSKGDWQVKVKNVEPAAWAFQFADSYYPDIDDTAEVLIALHWYQKNIQTDGVIQNAINKSIKWLFAMQSRNGGWGAMDKDNSSYLVTQLSFFDFGEIVDPPSVDVTAHVLEALGYLGFTQDHPDIMRALNFIYQEQEINGSWFGRWGVNYIYGTAAVLMALNALQIDMTSVKIQHSVDWLVQQQNEEGGWGESCASYASVDYGKGASTASQTAWVLLGLIAAGKYQHPAVTKGIAYLCNTQNEHGTWEEPYFTGCGFPGYLIGKKNNSLKSNSTQGKELSNGFLFRFGLYRHYWPLQALGRYNLELNTNKE